MHRPDDHHNYVAFFVYSKYSNYCSTLWKKIEDFRNCFGTFRRLRVDHEEVRKVVANDQNGYNIRYVPCILVVDSEGHLMKYEAMDAAVWVRQQIDRYSKSSSVSLPPSPSPSPSPPPSPSPSPPPSLSTPPLLTSLPTPSVVTPSQTSGESKDVPEIVASRKPANVNDVAQRLLKEREEVEKDINPDKEKNFQVQVSSRF